MDRESDDTPPIRKELDLRSDRCPVTFVKTRLALEPLEVGEAVRVHLCDPESVRNVPRSLEAEGCDVYAETQGPDGALSFSVHKTKLVQW